MQSHQLLKLEWEFSPGWGLHLQSTGVHLRQPLISAAPFVRFILPSFGIMPNFMATGENFACYAFYNFEVL